MMHLPFSVILLSLVAPMVLGTNLQIPDGSSLRNNCKTTQLASGSAEFDAAKVEILDKKGNVIGATRGGVPIFYVSDGSLAGEFGAVETKLGNTDEVLEAGAISFYVEDGTSEIQGSITFASIPSSGGTLFPLTGGVDSLACATGYIKAAGFDEVTFNFLLDLTICGAPCSS
jgi:hypothetical protein